MDALQSAAGENAPPVPRCMLSGCVLLAHTRSRMPSPSRSPSATPRVCRASVSSQAKVPASRPVASPRYNRFGSAMLPKTASTRPSPFTSASATAKLFEGVSACDHEGCSGITPESLRYTVFASATFSFPLAHTMSRSPSPSTSPKAMPLVMLSATDRVAVFDSVPPMFSNIFTQSVVPMTTSISPSPLKSPAATLSTRSFLRSGIGFQDDCVITPLWFIHSDAPLALTDHHIEAAVAIEVRHCQTPRVPQRSEHLQLGIEVRLPVRRGERKQERHDCCRSDSRHGDGGGGGGGGGSRYSGGSGSSDALLLAV